MNRVDGLKRNIVLYRLLLVVGANGLMTSVIYFFFTSVKEFSPAQSLFLIGLSALAKAVSEVPTGVVADRFSRKYSVVIGYGILLMMWLGLLMALNFFVVVGLIILGGIGGSFISGADDALLYDSLKELKIVDRFKKINSVSESMELVAFAATILIGGILGGFNLYWPVIAHLCLLSVSVVVSCQLTEPTMSKVGAKIENVGYLSHTLKSIRTIFSRRGFQTGLLSSFLSLALILAVFKSTKNILSPILNHYGLAIPTIGLTISAIIMVKAVGALIASKVTKPGREVKEVLWGLIVCIVGLAFISAFSIPVAQIPIFIVIIGLDNLILTNIKAIINEEIESRQRSTILSLLSLFARSSEMIFLTSFGWIIEVTSLNTALLFTGSWLVLPLLLLTLFHSNSASLPEGASRQKLS